MDAAIPAIKEKLMPVFEQVSAPRGRPHSIIPLANGADEGKDWDYLDAERNILNSFSNEEKAANLENGCFHPGAILRYRKNGTIRQVAGAQGQPQKLEPLTKGI